MRTRKKVVLDGITFEATQPTVVPFERLYTWVIWQFPRYRPDGYSGAVHPPEAGHGWYPAVIDVATGQVSIFGHVKEPFPTPEAATKHLDKATAS